MCVYAHTQRALGIDNYVIFSMSTIAANQRWFSSYCVIVLSDRSSVLLQSTPATLPFTGMLIQNQDRNSIMQHNSIESHLFGPLHKLPLCYYGVAYL